MEVLLDNPLAWSMDEERWVKAIVAMLQVEHVEERAEVSVTFLDDAGIHALNREHRGVDRPTDVLSFPLLEPGEDPPPEPLPLALGDIVVSLETAQRQAESYGHSLDREIGFLLAHGLLHLLGYDHEQSADEARMRERQRAMLEAVGLDLPGGAA